MIILVIESIFIYLFFLKFWNCFFIRVVKVFCGKKWGVLIIIWFKNFFVIILDWFFFNVLRVFCIIFFAEVNFVCKFFLVDFGNFVVWKKFDFVGLG